MVKALGTGWSAEARQRLVAVALTGLLLSFAYVACDVILPLWATKTLGFSPSDWAHLRSLRFAGVLVGVIVLGACSDRFGQRRLGILSLLGAALITAAFAIGGRLGMWCAMPVLGALVSTVMVNLNTMTQAISHTHQGVANTVYRAVGAGAGVVAPLAATALGVAWGGYAWVFVLLAGLMVVGAATLARYPDGHQAVPLGNLRDELRQLWHNYAVALRQKELMRFMHISQISQSLLAGVGAFAAIRFTCELGLSDRGFGLLSTIAGGMAFLMIASGAWFLDHVRLRTLHAAGGISAAIGSCLMGAGNNLWLSGAGFLLAVPVGAMLIAPSSMWVSRAAGAAAQVSAFSVHKVVSAVYLTAAMALLGVVESWLGMRLVFLICGLLAILASLGYLLLPEPPRIPPGVGVPPVSD